MTRAFSDDLHSRVLAAARDGMSAGRAGTATLGAAENAAWHMDAQPTAKTGGRNGCADAAGLAAASAAADGAAWRRSSTA